MTDLCVPLEGYAVADDAVSADKFKQGMRNLAGAVNVITAIKDDRMSGLTATAVMSVSAEPPRVMVCINKDVFAHSLINVGGSVCINTLGAEQIEQAKIFAGMYKEIAGPDRFSHGPWMLSSNIAPELEGALLSMQCKVVEIIPAHSHSMILCEVIDIKCSQISEKSALVYFDGYFSEIK